MQNRTEQIELPKLGGSAFGDPWDSGQVGIIYLPADKIVSEYGADTPENRDSARQCLIGEIETLDQYLRGDIYGYTIENAEGEDVDSCWGFFGLDTVREEVNAILDNLPHTLPLPECV